MKRLSIIIVFLSVCAIAMAQTLAIGQYNIRNANANDAKNGNGWQVRGEKIAHFINHESWDVFGLQEVLHQQIIDLKKGLSDYAYVGVARNDGAQKGEYAPIFYKKKRIHCHQSGTFWLSETPDVVGSKGWDAALPRICTWALLEDRTTKWRFWMFNLHLDHIGVEAREKSVDLVLQKIEAMCGDAPFILTGDFNVDQNSAAYQSLVQSEKIVDTYEKAKYKMAENGTFNSFNVNHKTEGRIDYIFVSKQFYVHTFGIQTPMYWRTENNETTTHQYSDHYPLSATLELPLLRAPKDWAQYGVYEKANTQTADAKVVFMGNSITSNWYKFHKEFFESNAGFVCRGISGQVTAQMLARFRTDVINLKPETVVILAGTNDLAMNQGYVSIEHIFENIVSMAELARYNKINVVLCSVLPADIFRWSWEVSSEKVISSIKELNAKIKAYADQQGIPYADYYSAMVDENQALKRDFQKDPVHPNLAGYHVMEQIICDILKQIEK
ncbi:MAG: endonuclease/exonuclease/phosphatase family protein [Bacteroidaceae bacterium]|nr:endonuclease/exonuclease/phosphatase family protein [Bacteroidaceae bacterium]